MRRKCNREGFCRRTTGATTEVPVGFVTAAELPVKAHLAMQAALQPFVDNSISKTINVPEGCPYSEFRQIYDLAYDMGLKGCTTFRPNPVTGAVLGEQPPIFDARIAAFPSAKQTEVRRERAFKYHGAHSAPGEISPLPVTCGMVPAQRGKRRLS